MYTYIDKNSGTKYEDVELSLNFSNEASRGAKFPEAQPVF